jgi:translocation and assembly module TamB
LSFPQRLRRRLALALALAALIAALAAASAGYWLERAPVQRHLQARLNQWLGGTLTWEKARFALLRGRVTLERVHLAAVGGGELVRAAEVRLQLDFARLLDRRVAAVIHLEAPRVHLSRDAAGRINLLEALAPDAPPPPAPPGAPASQWPAWLADLELVVRDGALTWDDAGASLRHLTLEGIQLQARADVGAGQGRMHLRLTAPRATLREQPLPPVAVEVAAAVAGGHLTIEACHLRTAGSHLSLEGRVADLGPEPALDLGVTLALEAAEWHPQLPPAARATGRVRLEGRLAGSLADPRIDARLDLHDVSLDRWHLPGGRLRIHLQDRRLDLEGSEVQVAGGRLALGGAVDLTAVFPDGFSGAGHPEALAYRLFLEGQDLALERLAPAAGVPPGRLALQAHIAGRGLDAPERRLEGELDLTVGDLRLAPDLPPVVARFAGRLEVADERLTVSGARLSLPGAVVQAHGSLDLARGNLQGRIDATADDAGRLPWPPSLGVVRGRLAFQADLAGSLTQPSVALRGQADSLSLAGLDLDRVEVTAGLDRNGRLDIRQALATRGTARLEASGDIPLKNSQGRLAWGPDTPLRLEARLTDLDLAELPVVPALGGRAAARLDLAGTWSDPAGTLHMEAQDLHWAQRHLGRLTARWRAREGLLRLEELDVRHGPAVLRATGWMARDTSFALEVTGSDLDLGHLAGLSDPQRLQGRLQVSLQGHGTLEVPHLEGRLELTETRLNDLPLEPFAVDLRLEGRRLEIRGQPGFDLAATADLDSGEVDLSAVFRQTDLALLGVLGGQPRLSGTLSGELAGRGNFRRPATFSARLFLSQAQARFGSQPLLEVHDLAGTFQEGRLSLPPALIRVGDHGRLTLEAEGRWDGPFSARLDGRVPAAWLAQWLEEDPDAQGQVGVAARLDGTLAAPRVSLDVALEDVGFDLPGLEQRVSQLQGHLRLGRERLSLDGVTGRIAAGDFRIQGDVALAAWVPAGMRLALEARNIPLSLPDTLEVQVDARLDLSGTPERSLLQGEILLLEGLYYRDIRLQPLEQLRQLTRRERATAPMPSGEADPRLSGMRLDVAVAQRQPLVVDNNLADFELAPDLRLVGTAARPVLTGRAEVVSGHLIYQKRRFEIRKGVVEFTDPYRTAPMLNIRGVMEVRRWQIFLDVVGPPEALDFRLSSEPPEPHEELLSLVLVGKTTAELMDTQGGATRTTEQMLAELAAASLEDDLRRITGLDMMEVEAAPTDDSPEATSLTVTLGKELSRRVTVKYRAQHSKGEIVQRGVAEYKLLERVILNAFQDTRGVFGGGLTFRLEFR